MHGINASIQMWLTRESDGNCAGTGIAFDRNSGAKSPNGSVGDAIKLYPGGTYNGRDWATNMPGLENYAMSIVELRRDRLLGISMPGGCAEKPGAFKSVTTGTGSGGQICTRTTQ